MLAFDWSAQAINMSEGQIKISYQLTPYLKKLAKLLVTNKPIFPQDSQDQGERT
jgi:hypothetical protein